MSMTEKKVLRDKIEKLLCEDPSIFGAIKSSLITGEMARYAVSHNPKNIGFVKNPSFELCQMAVYSDPSTILMIPIKFQKVLRSTACSKDPRLIEHFKNLCNSELEEIITNNPSAIQFIHNAPESLIRYAIKLNPNVALYYSEELLNVDQYQNT